MNTAGIVRPVPSFNTPGGIADIILSHHERYDGSGYPHGLCAEAIPVGARVVAAADTLSVLLRNRYYRQGCSFDAAFTEIIRCSGTQFDPVVVRMLGKKRQAVHEMLFSTEYACNSDFCEQIPALLHLHP